jgi:DNA uptake protein ComE-like DNA-binding protein
MTNYSAANEVTALGLNHGYCLDGDFVHLNADFSLAEADAAGGCSWALQLWASESGFDGLGLIGVKVAELDLQPLSGAFNVGACVAALPPAGCAPQVMALALVGMAADGSVSVRDLSVYPTPQSFLHPLMHGAVSCHLADGVAEIAIESIASPRSADNLSGTLTLEVWELDAPYAGGAWVGSPVASLVLGNLSGGSAWNDCLYSVPAVTGNPGAALTVMLREWTPAGYLTRDYRNLPAVVVEAPAASVTVASKVAKKVEKKVDKKPAPKAAAKPASKAVAKPAAKTAAATGPVSVNKASVGELAAVKGLSKAVAEAIVAARPYAKLDELVRAKGMGPKLLEKVGKLLKV